MLLVYIWSQIAPVSLGGPITIASTKGNSMEPFFYEGDFAVIHKNPKPQLGQILAYHSDQINSVVLHRAIELQDGRFVMKGDNNTWIDPELVAPDEVIGTYWFHISGIGEQFSLLQKPIFSIGLLLSSVFIGYSLIFAKSPKNRNRRARR